MLSLPCCRLRAAAADADTADALISFASVAADLEFDACVDDDDDAAVLLLILDASSSINAARVAVAGAVDS